MDFKMCLALTSLLKTAGDVARAVRIEVEKLQRHCAKHAKIMSGREVIAIMFENFRSSDNAEVMYTQVMQRYMTSTIVGTLFLRVRARKILPQSEH